MITGRALGSFHSPANARPGLRVGRSSNFYTDFAWHAFPCVSRIAQPVNFVVRAPRSTTAAPLGTPGRWCEFADGSAATFFMLEPKKTTGPQPSWSSPLVAPRVFEYPQ